MPLPGLMNGTALTAPGAPPGPPAGSPSPQGAAPGIMPPDDGDGPDSEGQGDDDSQPTPQEQQQYDQFMAQIRILLYKNKDMTQTMIQSLKTGDPVTALAHISVMAVMRVEAAAGQAGEQIDPAVLLHAGQEVVQDIADFSNQVSKAQGTPTFTPQDIQKAYLMAVDIYRQQKQQSGGINQAGAQQEWSQAQQADAQGDIDSVVPHATEAAKALAPVAKSAQQQVETQPGAGPTTVKKKPAPNAKGKRKGK